MKKSVITTLMRDSLSSLQVISLKLSGKAPHHFALHMQRPPMVKTPM
jgi:hypothetical protein